MRSLRHLVFALVAALALTVSQVVPVLHGLEHNHHHLEAAHRDVVAGDSHHSQGAEIDEVLDHELLHRSSFGTVSTNKADIAYSFLVAVMVVDVSTEPNDPPQDVTQPLPRLYVAAPPDQPRAPPAV